MKFLVVKKGLKICVVMVLGMLGLWLWMWMVMLLFLRWVDSVMWWFVSFLMVLVVLVIRLISICCRCVGLVCRGGRFGGIFSFSCVLVLVRCVVMMVCVLCSSGCRFIVLSWLLGLWVVCCRCVLMVVMWLISVRILVMLLCVWIRLLCLIRMVVLLVKLCVVVSG